MNRSTGADRLADVLRHQVLSGVLAPDTAMREEAISAEHGLSRHTVRRALERLVSERLLTSAPYRGVRVTSFTGADVIAMQQLRCALESEAVRLLRAEHGDTWPQELLAPLERTLDAMATAASPEQLHALFHRELVSAAGSCRITEAYAALDTEMHLFLRQLRFHYDAEDLCSEHRAYVADVQRVGEQAVRDHLERSTGVLLAARRQT